MSEKNSQNDKQGMMRSVYQAFRSQGLSDNQARALTAEVGRENDFNPKFIFGSHGDAANQKTNLGFISWQGGRRQNLIRHLREKGLLNSDGSIKRNQDSLNAMAGFLVHEIKSDPAYSQTKKVFLDNPNVDYRTAERVLGKNFIRWDYSGGTVLGRDAAKHHAKRDKYYAQTAAFSGMPVTDAPVNVAENVNPNVLTAAQTAALVDVPNVSVPRVPVDGVDIPQDGQQKTALGDFQQFFEQPKSAEDELLKREKARVDYVDSLRIKPLKMEPVVNPYQEQLAQAFGEYPDMSGAIPEHIDGLIQSIYDAV